MQARWGTHGDHPIIALAPASVQEIYSRRSAPSISPSAAHAGHPALDEIDRPSPRVGGPAARRSDRDAERKWANGRRADFHPFAETDDLVPPMARPGDGLRVHVTGLTHTAGRLSRPSSRRRRRRRRSACSTRSSAIATRSNASRRCRREDAEVADRRRRHRRARGARAPSQTARRRRQGRPLPADHAVAVPRGRASRAAARRARAGRRDERRPARARGRAARRRAARSRGSTASTANRSRPPRSSPKIPGARRDE